MSLEMNRSDMLSTKDAYLAMYYFVRAYWERGGKRDGSVTLLLHDIGPSLDPQNPEALRTADPAFWDDWTRASDRARREGVPQQL
jgi:hypothetical protein